MPGRGGKSTGALLDDHFLGQEGVGLSALCTRARRLVDDEGKKAAVLIDAWE
jgi:hypothetical protein